MPLNRKVEVSQCIDDETIKYTHESGPILMEKKASLAVAAKSAVAANITEAVAAKSTVAEEKNTNKIVEQ